MNADRQSSPARRTDETLNFSWLIRSCRRILVNVHTNLVGEDGVRGFAHRNVYALWRVHGICSYGGTSVSEAKPLWKFRLVSFTERRLTDYCVSIVYELVMSSTAFSLLNLSDNNRYLTISKWPRFWTSGVLQ